MVTPISNDKFPSASSSRAGGTDPNSTGSANKSNAVAATPEAAKSAEDTVNVDRASELYRAAASEPTRPAGNINTAEEALQLATRISEQLATDGLLAMQAQAGSQAGQVGSLLSATP